LKSTGASGGKREKNRQEAWGNSSDHTKSDVRRAFVGRKPIQKIERAGEAQEKAVKRGKESAEDPSHYTNSLFGLSYPLSWPPTSKETHNKI